ncbi:hypothetical protein BV898_08188 [Hypsibius exemplaris]|uniref:Uncharacterized protein n=1 Tax=Hypsibius exemplaris TaxID=2072580 RepID=A0A1W0WRA0_HYPEX|nr:hypothetical protein BV898_08188 [Hypsibius exemplaris]
MNTWLAGISFLLFVSVYGSIIQVEIACPGVINLVSELGLGYQGPAFDAAIHESNNRYAGIFNFTRKALVYPGRVENMAALVAESANMVAAWFFNGEKGSPETVRAIIAPGTVVETPDHLPYAFAFSVSSLDSTNVHQLMANWNIMAITVSGGLKSEYSLRGPLMVELAFTGTRHPAAGIVATIRLCNWTSLFLVADSDSSPVFKTTAGEIVKLAAATAGVNNAKSHEPLLTFVQRIVASSDAIAFQSTIHRLLLEFQISSRGKPPLP